MWWWNVSTSNETFSEHRGCGDKATVGWRPRQRRGDEHLSMVSFDVPAWQSDCFKRAHMLNIYADSTCMSERWECRFNTVCMGDWYVPNIIDIPLLCQNPLFLRLHLHFVYALLTALYGYTVRCNLAEIVIRGSSYKDSEPWACTRRHTLLVIRAGVNQ